MFWKKKIAGSVIILVYILMIWSISIAWERTIKLNIEESFIEVTFLANEGVLISTHEKKVLIDALFDNPNPNYAAPPKDMLERMVAGRAPFDDVGLIHLPKRLMSDAPSKIDMVKSNYKDLFLFLKTGEKKTIR